MEITPREAFRIFIRHQLRTAVAEAKLSMNEEDIEQMARKMEDDDFFYDKLNDFLADFVIDYGEKYED